MTNSKRVGDEEVESEGADDSYVWDGGLSGMESSKGHLPGAAA